MQGEHEAAKKDLSELFKAYKTAAAVVIELRDSEDLNPHDCDNILGHLKSGMIEDVLVYTRTHLVQTPDKGVVKAAQEYLAVKAALDRMNLKEGEAKEILGMFFKK